MLYYGLTTVNNLSYKKQMWLHLQSVLVAWLACVVGPFRSADLISHYLYKLKSLHHISCYFSPGSGL